MFRRHDVIRVAREAIYGSYKSGSFETLNGPMTICQIDLGRTCGTDPRLIGRPTDIKTVSRAM